MSPTQGCPTLAPASDTSGSNDTASVLEKAKVQWRNLFGRPSSPTDAQDNNLRHRRPSFLTRRNQRENRPWGDILAPKEMTQTRVYVQNVNGLSIDRRGGQLNNVCEVMQEIQADIFCGQEHNLDVTQMSIRSTLYDTVRQYWDRTKFIAGTTPIPFTMHYKPGGTFLLTIENLSGRIINQVQDRWGR